ncbi:hypothetical protein [Nostoc sp. UHCC 0252]|uniref:hypothetical protein n=1 Tax=Nostoc sp. UHCC 0252 TaxID=3110241 RepID=UPI002B1EC26C|nr:hypothetical protein [Nostoc sp. UHCC 0252]MEA5604852.1 hypothetical protein [Nostoc sp. UHCC 0252]
MLDLISLIPTTVREGFDVQDLPHRASDLSEDTLANIFGGWCIRKGHICAFSADCCRSAPNCIGKLFRRCAT